MFRKELDEVVAGDNAGFVDARVLKKMNLRRGMVVANQLETIYPS